MNICMMKSKLHRATVTELDIDYEGSLGIDLDLIEAAGLYVNERIDIYNINNGQRFSTYVIEKPRGSKEFSLNGAAARLACKGDKIIIVSYAFMDEKDAKKYKPTVIKLKEGNEIAN